MLNNLLTSNYKFNKNEELQKYRFILLNSILISGLFIAFFAGLYRLNIGPTALGIVDISLSFAFAFLLFFLRKEKKHYNLISTITLVISFFGFTTVVLLLDFNQSKMVWYSLLIISAFLIKGSRFGLYASATVILTLFALYFLPFVDIYLEDRELTMATIAYVCITIFSTYAAKAYEKSIINLKKSNQQIYKQQKQLYNQLRLNPFTKLPNQYALEEYLESEKDDISLVVLDIDAFDTIISEFGKPFADQIIIQVNQTLNSFTAHHARLFHLFTDRFAFVIKNYENNQDINLAKSTKSLFENLHLTHKEIDISITFSIGIARENSEKIILQANSALNDVKLQGKNGYKLFDNGIEYEKQQKNNIYWAKRIKEIIMEDNLIVYYQPIVNNKNGLTEKYECLVRAIDNEKIVPPHFFLEVAQTRGYLKNITKIIIDKSFRSFQNSHFDFSINITQDDLKDDGIVNFLRYKVEQYNINPNRVYLEILESVTSLHAKETEEIFKEFKKIGFKIAIDDFGTETSNFSRVLSIDADIIKIDGAFIKNLDKDKNSIKIVETIVSFAQKIGAKTVAEFVHNKEVYEIVKSLGVDYSQGYYLSPPLPQIDEVSQKPDVTYTDTQK